MLTNHDHQDGTRLALLSVSGLLFEFVGFGQDRDRNEHYVLGEGWG
jgi:hypothetical protein